jgi:hypothetical protein
MTTGGFGSWVPGDSALPGAAPPVLVPPRGPGVVPPFAAPPNDGIRKRMWIGLGLGAAVLVICLIGGVAGLGALVVSSSAARRDAATKVVTEYLTAWQQRRYMRAYDLTCDEVRNKISLGNFADELDRQGLTAFELEPAVLTADDTYVPATLHVVGGVIRTERISVVVQSDGDSVVCGLD